MRVIYISPVKTSEECPKLATIPHNMDIDGLSVEECPKEVHSKRRYGYEG